MATTEGQAGAYGPVVARGRHGARPAMTAGERVQAVAGLHLAGYKNTWRGSIIGRFLSPLLFLLAMGLGLGSLVDDAAGGIDGVPYLQFVVPAIVATQTMWTAMNESTYPVLGFIRWNMGYHAQLATPLTIRDILAGHLLVVAGHITLGTAIFMVVAALFGGFGSWLAVFALPVAVLTGMAFAIPIFAFTAKQEGDDGFSILFRWIMTPLMLFSGTFFPIDQLPVWLQPAAWLTPLWHGVESCRMLSSGVVDLPMLALHVAVLGLYAGVGWVLAVRTFSTRLVS